MEFWKPVGSGGMQHFARKILILPELVRNFVPIEVKPYDPS